MAKQWLEFSTESAALEVNATLYGYPSAGTPLVGGIVSAEPGGVGWTTQQDEMRAAEKGGPKRRCVHVDLDEIEALEAAQGKGKNALAKALRREMALASLPADFLP